MCILKKTKYSTNEILFLVLIANESTIKHFHQALLYCLSRIYIFIYGHEYVSFSFCMHIMHITM